MKKEETKEEKLEKKEEKPLRYNLACGDVPFMDFIGVDIVKEGTKADIVFDLTTFPWTFAKDNSVDELFCSHYIEHTPDLIKFMDECFRILKVGGKLIVIAPYWSSVRAWQDPTHKRTISESSFLYFNKDWRKMNKLEHYGIKSDFDFTYAYFFNGNWASRSEEARMFAITHYINVISDIQVVLTKK